MIQLVNQWSAAANKLAELMECGLSSSGWQVWQTRGS